MIRRPPRSTLDRSSAASDVYKRQLYPCGEGAGYAGGIVSAAMDGQRVADRIADRYAAVSYTHLRAHETVLDLVCRLLLEKKNIIHRQDLEAVTSWQHVGNTT